jgi:hypothetical protein
MKKRFVCEASTELKSNGIQMLSARNQQIKCPEKRMT